ncbi:MAG: hypothetical protein KDA33_08410, partial [Phycisphaerales bacterium]|nr:hypothetical protein [Phycisphaerales bacterium]
VRNIAGRTCPECGDTFSIGEARVAGIADDPRSADDRKVILREKVFNYGAIAVFVVCFFTPFIHSGRFPTAGGVFLQLVLLAPFVTFGVGVSHYFSRSVSESAIITVALYAGFTALCVMLF